MTKPRIIVACVLFCLLALGVWHSLRPHVALAPTQAEASDVKNARYTINNQQVHLLDGFAQTEAAPGSASKITTSYFGNDVQTDLNHDGRPDTVFLLTQDTGGSGVFYYVVAALNTPHGYIGSSAFFLGDRIAPQSTDLGKNGTIVVNFADRDASESFAVAPHNAKSVYLSFDPVTMEFTQTTQTQ